MRTVCTLNFVYCSYLVPGSGGGVGLDGAVVEDEGVSPHAGGQAAHAHTVRH